MNAGAGLRRQVHALVSRFPRQLAVSPLAAVVAALLAGCAFNLEEETATFSWSRYVPGVASVVVDEEALAGSALMVTGRGDDSLVVSCDVRRLVTTDDDASPDGLDLRANRTGDTVALSLFTVGDAWVTYQMGDAALELAADCDLKVVTGNGSIAADGTRGFMTIDAVDGEVDVETSRGAGVDTRGPVAVTLCIDTADTNLDSLFQGIDIQGGPGAVLVRVPAGLSAELDLKTRGGDIEVFGDAVDGDNYTGYLNGGVTGRQIRVETGSGDITIRALGAP